MKIFLKILFLNIYTYIFCNNLNSDKTKVKPDMENSKFLNWGNVLFILKNIK